MRWLCRCGRIIVLVLKLLLTLMDASMLCVIGIVLLDPTPIVMLPQARVVEIFSALVGHRAPQIGRSIAPAL